MTTPANRRMRRAFAVLIIIGIALNGALLVFFAHAIDASHAEVSRTRDDFCVFAASIVTAAHQLPQVPGRIHAENAYAHLQNQLNCQGGPP